MTPTPIPGALSPWPTAPYVTTRTGGHGGEKQGDQALLADPGLANSSKSCAIMPLIAYPNPHARPAQGDAGHAEWQQNIMVQRNWRPDELKDITEDMPDPTQHAVKFCEALQRLVAMYRPSAAELAHICRSKMGLRWADIQGDFDENMLANTAGFQAAVTALCDRIKTQWPRKTDWARVHACKQEQGEDFETYRKRLEEVFKAHSGLDPRPGVPAPDDPYRQLLKQAMVAGLLPEIGKLVKQGCVAWEVADPMVVIEHCKHAERQLQTEKDAKDSMKERRGEQLQMAQLAQLEGRGGEQGSHQSRVDRDQCFRCGRTGHLARECNQRGEQGGDGAWYEEPCLEDQARPYVPPQERHYEGTSGEEKETACSLVRVMTESM